MFELPKNEKELQEREAIGIIRASRFVRKYAKNSDAISVSTIREIHKEIFNDARPDIAGKYRREDVKITDSKHKPPHWSKVPELMKLLDNEITEKLAKLKNLQGSNMTDDEFSDEDYAEFEKILSMVAWIHHRIVFIHPFVEGNGRTARLTANLVLERYGLVGISVKYEKENKNKYRSALHQMDEYNDSEPLKEIVVEGLIERYESIH